MRIIRVRHQGQTFYASLGDGVVISLGREAGAETIPLAEVTLMPLVVPSKIISVGFNFEGQASSFGIEPPEHPLFFLRPTTSATGNGRPVVMPHGMGTMRAEAELALVIGQRCSQVSPDTALRHVFGYTCANDLSVGDERTDPFLTRGKCFNGTCPVGPWLETQMPDLRETPVRCLINGETHQEASLGEMIFSPAEILSYLSQIMTLNPGDIILTGAPSGIAEVRPGDTVQVEIPGVGVLFNAIESENSSTPPVQ